MANGSAFVASFAGAVVRLVPHYTRKRSVRMKEFFKRPKVIAIIVVSVLALILLFQNIDIVTFRMFFWTVEVSQLVLVVLMLAIGYILGFLTAKFGGKKE
jgi:uncharacterized integral membrane protein